MFRLWWITLKKKLNIEDVSITGPIDHAEPPKKKKKTFEFFEDNNKHWQEAGITEVRFRAFTHSSSFVGNVKYDQDSQSMEAILNDKTYKFCNVSERLFDSWRGADSKGAFFNREVKSLHDC